MGLFTRNERRVSGKDQTVVGFFILRRSILVLNYRGEVRGLTEVNVSAPDIPYTFDSNMLLYKSLDIVLAPNLHSRLTTGKNGFDSCT